jgi:hypothetical protein
MIAGNICLEGLEGDSDESFSAYLQTLWPERCIPFLRCPRYIDTAHMSILMGICARIDVALAEAELQEQIDVIQAVACVDVSYAESRGVLGIHFSLQSLSMQFFFSFVLFNDLFV